MPLEPDPSFHRPSRTLILGHRGASAHLPENTLASYQAAIEEGAEGIESDIHKTRDDVLLMFHDPSLERTTNGTGKIREKDWHGDIEHLRTKKEPVQPIPRFEELLDLIMKPENRHVILNIDVKIFSDPNEIFPLMHKHISSYPSYETLLSPRLILGLWHPLFIAPAKRYLPTLVRYHIGLSTHIARKYFWNDMHGFSIAFPMLTSKDGQKFLEDCKREGKGVMTWTVNREVEMRVARTWGVGWVITDKVALAVDTRQEWENNPDILRLTTMQKLYWSWTDWRFYSIPQSLIPQLRSSPHIRTLGHYGQSMFLRWVSDNLQKNAFKVGPLEDALEEGGEVMEPVASKRA